MRLAGVTSVWLMLLIAGAAGAQRVGTGWTRVPDVVVIGVPDDPRHAQVREAVEFWNRELAAIGSAFRIGAVRSGLHDVPVDALRLLSARSAEGPVGPDAVPAALRELPGDITLFLTDLALASFAGPMVHGRRVVGIRSHAIPPLSLPNVSRNVIAHELGHAIGLLHHDDPTRLMCGRPAPCRPEMFSAPVEGLFALAEQDRLALLRLYPPDWAPARPR